MPDTEASTERRAGPGRRGMDHVTEAEFKRHRLATARGLNRIARELERVTGRLEGLTGRVNSLDLNGSAAGLRELGYSAMPLRELADRAGPLLKLAEQASVLLQPDFIKVAQALTQQQRGELLVELLDDATARHVAIAYTKKVLRPWKPIGLLIWFFLIAVVSALGYAVVHVVRTP